MPATSARSCYIIYKAVSGRFFYTFVGCHIFTIFVANYTFVFRLQRYTILRIPPNILRIISC
nr:MAG TPA: hypothetical protein [Caudoviricetes sp.]